MVQALTFLRFFDSADEHANDFAVFQCDLLILHVVAGGDSGYDDFHILLLSADICRGVLSFVI